MIKKDAWCDFSLLKYIKSGFVDSWRIFHVYLKRSCILLLLDKMLWKYQLSLPGLMYHLRSVFAYWFSVWWSLHWWKWGVEVPHCIIVLLPVSPSWLLAFALYIAVLVCQLHIYLQLLYLCLRQMPLLCRVLLYVTVFILRFISSDMNIAIPAFFWLPFP